MKKLLSLFSAFLLCAFCLNAQTFLTENFNGSAMPTGWTIQNQTSNWSISNTNNAGGTARELRLTWTPQFNGKTRFISPVINLSGATDLVIEFLHHLNRYQGTNIIGIETTSNGGTTWNLAFQKSFTSNQTGKIVEVITTPDVGSSTFQFCLYFNGSSFDINDWYFDNFKLFARYNTNAAMSSVNNETYNLEGSQTVNVTVTNLGHSTINTIEMRYQFNDLPPVTETFTSFNLPTLQSRTVSFSQPANLEQGSFVLKVEILNVNGAPDDNPDDNLLTKNIYTAFQQGTRRVCIEHFTSSTCTPCVNPNIQMKNLLAANPDKYGITKYQMSWPAPGDPYYTVEGGTRRTYYAVSGVPTIFFNGKRISSVSQATLNTALTEQAFIDISGRFSVDGNNIIISGKVDTYIDIPEARLYVVVNEKRTTGNVGNNGETEFFHVMMKMLPSANGTTINMAAGETINFQHTFDMSSTKVEEMDDLEVHVFVQDHGSRYIFNSNFLMECEEVLEPENLTAQQEGTSVTLTWNDANSNSDRYTLYFNGVKLAENITETNYIHQNAPMGMHTYGISAFIGNCQSEFSEISFAVCGDAPNNFTAQQDDTSVILNWEADYEGSYSFTLFFNGEILEENITSKTYTHQNVPVGEHAYGILAVIGDCPFQVVERNITILGIDDYNSLFRIFPNPANNYIIIEGSEIETVSLYNNLGQLITSVTATDNFVKVNTNDYNSGIYFLHIHTVSGITTTEKIIIQK